MTERMIEEIVDSYLQKWIDAGLNMQPGEIEKEMAGPKNGDGWTTWYPIHSQVTDSVIDDFEEQIGYRFPTDYRQFLLYKHFYELNIFAASFTHAANTWRRAHVELIFESYPREFMIDKGYLPIASWSDWGMLCFDTNTGDGSTDYPVVLWDHESARKVTPFYKNFTNLLRGLDQKQQDKERELDTSNPDPITHTQGFLRIFRKPTSLVGQYLLEWRQTASKSMRRCHILIKIRSMSLPALHSDEANAFF